MARLEGTDPADRLALKLALAFSSIRLASALGYFPGMVKSWA